MSRTHSAAGDDALAAVAARHGLSLSSVESLLVALERGQGRMAQFSVPELGGRGQWMRGGMTMVSDLFDNALKARVDAVCTELSDLLASGALGTVTSHPMQSSGDWWPAELGVPSSSGSQNSTRYAYFPGTRRLAIHAGAGVEVYDTGDHTISGVSQQQSSGSGRLEFRSQHGTFDVASLSRVGAASEFASESDERVDREAPAPTPAAAPAPPRAASSDAESVVAAIEALARLREQGLLTDDEFQSKKTELLSRL
ncbi:SHOCT domain-containing protein [Antrihabitans sp. YC3-6]|uniref:SHOCT domain-containing protein n=1 Tax=Antrihabitans stalagmiti TaxID=2799499 RepID=A0A934NW12_9NOCA|nr:SHOCT domain-containing protein [Antrihabitans stalagmiti]MBJ8342613.1 SHOCT domain-containing protein [Antrihabitans stalagmiti]